MTLATVFGLAVVYLMFPSARPLPGWTFPELLFLYGFSLLPMSMFNVISVNLYQFSETYLIQGKMDRVLLRPVHSLFQVLCEQLRLEAMGDAVLGIVILIAASKSLTLTITPFDMFFLAIAAIFGAVLYTAMFTALAACSFWFEDRVGIMPPVYNLISFGRYPLDIYNGFIRVLLSWVAPMGFATFYPAASILRPQAFGFYAWLIPVVTAAFCMLAIWVWNRGIRAYGSTGT
ncbi:MAG: ABC-2 family transporter protein [Candidatus Solibacter usitatus]|nr:ABC-2 family transporter protein [Candidatus Solibacter usitatus]